MLFFIFGYEQKLRIGSRVKKTFFRKFVQKEPIQKTKFSQKETVMLTYDLTKFNFKIIKGIMSTNLYYGVFYDLVYPRGSITVWIISLRNMQFTDDWNSIYTVIHSKLVISTTLWYWKDQFKRQMLLTRWTFPFLYPFPFVFLWVIFFSNICVFIVY